MILVISYEIPYKFADFETPDLVGACKDANAADHETTTYVASRCDVPVTLAVTEVNGCLTYIVNEVEPPWFIKHIECPDDMLTKVWKPVYQSEDKRPHIVFTWSDATWTYECRGVVAGQHAAEQRVSMETDSDGIYHRVLGKDPSGIIRAETQGWHPKKDKSFLKVALAIPWDGQIKEVTIER
jgi:hypothetical protein